MKIVTGYVTDSQAIGSEFTLERLPNQQYRVTWAAGTFPSLSIPHVLTYSGTVPLASWGADGSGAGNFLTAQNIGTTFWFTITQLR